MAVLIYFTYSNLLKLMQAWVGSGKIDFVIGSWILHIIGALLGLAFIFYRQNRSITIYGLYKRFLNKRTSGGSSDVA
jgi:lipopolysaccharide export system permease protein